MKRFLVCTSIGGAQITKRAWDYLVGNQQEKYSDIWNKYFSLFGTKNEDDEYILFNFYSTEALEFREIVLRLVEDLNYDYTELDKLNGDSLLRIVEVPMMVMNTVCKKMGKLGVNMFLQCIAYICQHRIGI